MTVMGVTTRLVLIRGSLSGQTCRVPMGTGTAKSSCVETHMEFGLFYDFDIQKGKTQAETFERSFKQVEESERMGVDTIWLAEVHFSPYSVLSSPLIVASSVATRTSRVRIGIAVQVLPLANPLRIAEEAATLDQISMGRLDFGVGRSGLTRYYKGYNIDYYESSGRFQEAMDIITKAWGDGPFSHEGEFYSYQDVSVEPKPYQEPHPPIRVAAASADTFSMVGSMGYPIFISTTTDGPELIERLKLYRDAWRDAGHPGSGDALLRIPAYVSDNAEKARSEPEASTMYMIGYSAAQIGSSPSQEVTARLERLAKVTYDDVLRHKVMHGTPEEVVERIQEYKEELGISGLVLEMNYGGQIPNEQVLGSIRLLTEKVMPKFK